MARTHLVESQGEILPGSTFRGDGMVQAMAGFRPLAPFGSPDGIGNVAFQQPRQRGDGSLGFTHKSPIVKGIKDLRRGLRGLGDDATSTPSVVVGNGAALAGGALVAAAMLGIALTGVSGYYVGKAVAPSSSKASKYAWWGVAAALLGGPLGLGIEAAVALNHKG